VTLVTHDGRKKRNLAAKEDHLGVGEYGKGEHIWIRRMHGKWQHGCLTVTEIEPSSGRECDFATQLKGPIGRVLSDPKKRTSGHHGSLCKTGNIPSGKALSTSVNDKKQVGRWPCHVRTEKRRRPFPCRRGERGRTNNCAPLHIFSKRKERKPAGVVRAKKEDLSHQPKF